MTTTQPQPDTPSAKQQQLESVTIDPRDTRLTTDQGILVDDTDNSVTVGERGPTLLEDFHMREKVMRFDHERIPERVVHARGSGAHGYFQAYDDSLRSYTTAEFLCDPDLRTPVFVRFSTVQGSRGSTDTPRDVRGFATKFYTGHGNFDLVGNNMPVFFIQDGIKFPDFVHALKPEPHHEMPQAASAHDTLWDFVSLQPETMHHIIWLMSDRAIPRSYRMMQGFGVHTFRLIDAEGRSTFVKFHWTPKLGTHSLVWDEAQKISGKDPDFNRRDLWEAIEAGQYPEYELGLQLIPEDDEHSFDFDLLDPTKIVPEEVVPLTPVGRMVLDRNPENFFAETEQVAFCVGNVVPGIGFTNDPLLHARLFSYLDTQLTRLGGPNFAQLPINTPVAAVRHHQRDGFGQHQIHSGQANYHPNSLGGGCPAVAGAAGGGYVHYPEHVSGPKLRKRPESFADHYSQATLFWNSMSGWEQEHIIAAYRFELGKVETMQIRQRVVEHLNEIDHDLAAAVAAGIGVEVPTKARDNHGRSSPALSQANNARDSIFSRRVAVLVADGVDAAGVSALRDTLQERGAIVELLAPVGSPVRTNGGAPLPVTRAMNTVGSVLYDAVVVPDGAGAAGALTADGYAVHFVAEAYKHAKAVGILGAGARLLDRAGLPIMDIRSGVGQTAGLIQQVDSGPASDEFVAAFIDAVAGHRHFDRERDSVPA